MPLLDGRVRVRVRRIGHLCVISGSALLMAGLMLVATGRADARFQQSAQDNPLAPDLVIRPVTELSIDTASRRKLLRFATRVGNSGAGIAELAPGKRATDCDGDGDPSNDRRTFQRLYQDTDGNGYYTRDGDELLSRIYAGCSIYHPAHNHWHFEEFARYVLERPVTGRVVASSEKVSFCVRDSLRFGSFAGSPAAAYYGDCTQGSIMGLSIGWADLYSASLPGQELNVRGLPDGRYCLRMTANPAGRIRESDRSNNTRSTLLRMRGSMVRNLRQRC